MNNNAADKGMTLIELIIALAILGIITVAFLNGFTGAFTTILGMGHKTVAMAEAQTIMDKFYESQTDAESYLSAHNADAISVPYDPNDPLEEGLRYDLESKSVDGNTIVMVKVRVYYQKGKHYVTLTSLIP